MRAKELVWRALSQRARSHRLIRRSGRWEGRTAGCPDARQECQDSERRGSCGQHKARRARALSALLRFDAPGERLEVKGVGLGARLHQGIHHPHLRPAVSAALQVCAQVRIAGQRAVGERAQPEFFAGHCRCLCLHGLPLLILIIALAGLHSQDIGFLLHEQAQALDRMVKVYLGAIFGDAERAGDLRKGQLAVDAQGHDLALPLWQPNHQLAQ